MNSQLKWIFWVSRNQQSLKADINKLVPLILHPKALAFGSLMTLHKRVGDKNKRSFSAQDSLDVERLEEDENKSRKNQVSSSKKEMPIPPKRFIFEKKDSFTESLTYPNQKGVSLNRRETKDSNQIGSFSGKNTRKSGVLNPPMTSRARIDCSSEGNEEQHRQNRPNSTKHCLSNQNFEELSKEIYSMKNHLTYSLRYSQSKIPFQLSLNAFSFGFSSFLNFWFHFSSGFQGSRVNEEMNKFYAMWKNERVKNVLLDKELMSVRQALSTSIQYNKKLQEAYSIMGKKSTENKIKLDFYESMYLEYMDFLKSRSHSRTQKAVHLSFLEEYNQTAPNEQSQALNLTNLDAKLVNMSVLDESVIIRNSLSSLKQGATSNSPFTGPGSPPQNEDGSLQKKPQEPSGNSRHMAFDKVHERHKFTLNEAKEYLKQLAMDMLLNMKDKSSLAYHFVKNLPIVDNKIIPLNSCKIERSMSNPLLYRSWTGFDNEPGAASDEPVVIRRRQRLISSSRNAKESLRDSHLLESKALMKGTMKKFFEGEANKPEVEKLL